MMLRLVLALALLAMVLSLLVSGPSLAIKVYVNPSVQTSNYSPDGAYQEGSNMQDVANRLVSKLQARGFEARNSAWMSLEEACNDSNAWGSNCFVALHTDATGSSGWVSNHGTRGFFHQSSAGWHDDTNIDFAQHIVNRMVANFAPFGRGHNLGTQADYPWCGWNMYVLAPWNNSTIPSTLIEGLFHDNWDDVYGVLLVAAGRDAYAQGVFEGICDYYGLSYSAGIPEIYVEPRGQNNAYYAEDGNPSWGNSAGWCNAFDANITSGGSRYFPSGAADPTGCWVQVSPVLRVPGGTYQVDMAHYSNDFISTDIVTSTSLANCTATHGNLASGSTTAFQQIYGCQWMNLGTIVLTAGETHPTIRFTYQSGNVNDGTHRWNVEAFRFGLVPTSSTLTLTPSAGGMVSGAGAKTAGDTVTATALPNGGYRFLNWTIGGFGGTVVSTEASYAFTMPGQGYALYANFALIGTVVTNVACPTAGGTLTGAGYYTSGQPITVTATAATGYTFVNWTTGSCGGAVVSTSSSYTFTAGSTDITLYANFSANTHTLSRFANPSSRGSVSGDSGIKGYAASCTVSATPNTGQYFGGWSTDDEGTQVVSTNLQYNFTMPDNDYTLYANFYAQPLESRPAVTDLAISPSQYINTPTAVATWTGTNCASYELKVDDDSWTASASGSVLNMLSLSYGVHTLYVRGLDGSGAPGQPSCTTFTVDRSSVRNWSVIGFYPWGSSSSDPAPGRFANNFMSPTSEMLVLAKTGSTYGGKSWFTYSSPSPIVDFDAVYGSNNTYGVSYLFTYIKNNGSAISGARLTCGSDDGIKAIFNGVAVLSNNVYRGLTMDSDLSSPFTILAGTNRLLVKVTQGSGSHSAQVRLCNADRTDPSWLSQLSFFPSDDAAPTGSVLINGGAGYTTSTSVTLTLSATDNTYPVKTMCFSNDNVTYTTPETYTTTKAWTLTAGSGLKTVYAKFTDQLGNVSSPCSAQITLGPAPTDVARIGDLWPLSNGPVYALYGKVVTAKISGAFWIEELSRNAAVKVLYSGPVAVAQGHSVDVIGSLSTDDRRALTAVSVTDYGPATAAILPFWMGQYGMGGASVNADTPGVTGARGIYSVGLLVKTLGSVTDYSTAEEHNKCFWLDDGSKLSDGLGHTGLKVNCGDANPPQSGRVMVTGVIDLETVNGAVRPVLIVRDPTEIISM